MASFVKQHLDTKDHHNIFGILMSSLSEIEKFSEVINNLGANFAKVYSLEEKE